MFLLKEYSLSYVKANKTSAISIIIAALISSALLSLICGIFYNIWADEIRLIKLQEGDWHGKITGVFSEEEVAKLESHPNVKEVYLEENETDQTRTAFLYLYHPRQVYKELPKLVQQLDANNNTLKLEYHDKLLNQYFIFAKGHNPPLILLVYLFTLLIAGISLILVIHNAFGVSMMARLHQLGILQSVGATPRQLRTVLIHEAVILCMIPVLSGVLAGTGLCYVFMIFVKNLIRSVRVYELSFQYHPFVLLAALGASILTVWYSARIPARKLSRLTPLEAIQYEGELTVSRKKHFSLLSRLFGTEGELAENSLYTRRKAFRTCSISLTLSFLVFSSFLNLEAISAISTKHTFFERYKNTWDLMLAVQNPEDKQEELVSNIRNIPGVKSCISYQKAEAYTKLDSNLLSDELTQLGGLAKLLPAKLQYDGDQFKVNAPLIILDKESFLAYYQEISAASNPLSSPDVPYVIVINTIWNSINSNYRYKKMIPFIKIGESNTLELVMNESKDGKSSKELSVKIAAAADKLPNIREEFDDYSLIQIMPESIYHKLEQNSSESRYYYTIRANSVEEIGSIQKAVEELMGDQYVYALENRAEMEKNDAKIRSVYKIVIGCLAGLLVIIGLANVLSNTLGLIYQRKRELARYIAIGVSSKGVIKILMLEATILVVKPILISLLVNILLVALSLGASSIRVGEFLLHIPIIPIAIFSAVMILTVEAAYYIGARRIYKINMVDALKDDTMI